MSGHSKWATTKRKKWAVDTKRSASFTKLANAVTIAAKNGGDPSMNFQLRLAIDRAKASSMPKDNIDRAIKRGTGEIGGATIEEIAYEGYGPGGVAILIKCLTDNRQRTVSNIRSFFNKFGGSLAETGSVAYLFEKMGQIVIERKPEIPVSQAGEQNPNDETKKENNLEEIIINSGADNFEEEDENIIVYTQLNQLQSVTKSFQDAGVNICSSEIVYLPKTTIGIDDSKQSSLDNLLNALDDNDDIVEVYTNLS